ncbi:unnamed protein product [Lepeophtheirus salmonis]|uniref:(salmon louse) hypothetical protein n=1 Tax=Lepeophtheirus salmonis TaxID=72036 RepID=A0A7R8CHN4_LEPSM|nr:unnamed protein product [Lepeophtheirus salmonis]CAF2825763.1 unnamed protein product [Lepeophtheirus salmonis]
MPEFSNHQPYYTMDVIVQCPRRANTDSGIWRNVLIFVILFRWSYIVNSTSDDTKDFHYLLSFQEDGRVSNESWAMIQGHETLVRSTSHMTICYWFKIIYHQATMTIASYCTPSTEDSEPKCSNIQFHIDDTLDWNTFRVEFSVSNVKTKSLRIKVNPKSWNHQCLTYKDGKISLFGAGYLQSQAYFSNIPIFGPVGALVLGQEQEGYRRGYDHYDSFSGYLTEFNSFDRILTRKEIWSLANCEVFIKGSLVNWKMLRNKWKLSQAFKKILSFNDLKNEICPNHNRNDFEKEIHGGELPVPLNNSENKIMAGITLRYISICKEEGKNNIIQPYMWIGIHSYNNLTTESGKQIWKKRITNEILNYDNWEVDEGSEGDTCARMQGNGKWRDTVCKKTTKHCTICDGLADQIFSLRGLSTPKYEGLFSQIMKDTDHVGRWVIGGRLEKSYGGYTNPTENYGYPIGRHQWLIKDPSCEIYEDILVDLTLSRCTESEFTCSNGYCIPQDGRCDFAQDCSDLSDELNCDTIIIPNNYLKKVPPTNATHPESPLTVTLNANIMNVDRIDTIHMMFAVTMEMYLEWKDHRLSFKNLRSGSGQNQLSDREVKRIWKPDVSLNNAKIGTLQCSDLGINVKRENEALPFDYSNNVEDKIYQGRDNSIILARKVYVEYGCSFDLRRFPFDTQECTMNFTMDSAKSKYVILEAKEVNYHGKIMLLEFFLQSIRPILFPISLTQSDKSMVIFEVVFHRESGNMVNTFFQTFLLCLMAYLTLYINLTDFANSLLASIEENFPKTSYFKNIDIWFMSYIIFIFIIIVFHIWVDFYTGHRDKVIDNHHVVARQKKRLACYWNTLGKTVFPVILCVFTILYFILSMQPLHS